MGCSSRKHGHLGINNCQYLLIITTCLVHAVHVPSTHAAQSTDEQALLEFKAAISGDPDGVLAAWTSTTNGSMNATDDFCRWRGVSCRSRRHPGRVTALELMSSNLTGVISPSLANLSFLRTLNLSGNRLSGGIPSELGLPRLQVISLGGNSLTGEIPASLANCARLTHLELPRNGLHGEIPANFSYCRELRVFNVSVNSLSGGIPTSFGSLSKLEFLGLHRGNLTGGIPRSLGNLSSLLAFDASENYNLGGGIPDTLGRLTKLNFLRLASAGLGGAIPVSLFNISSLITLDLGNNDHLSGMLPPDIGIALPRIQFLSLYSCRLEGSIPPSIGNATGLRVIQLQSNGLQGSVPHDIGRLKDLAVLNLQFNQLEDKWDKDWAVMAALGNCSRLFALSLSSNKFQGVLPPSLVNLTIGIEQIFMNANRISGAIAPEIGKLTNLRVLALADNRLTGTIPSTIGGLRSMTGLDVSGNNISGEIPSMLVANLTRLAFLDLSQNDMQGSIPQSLRSMSNIAILDLSYNRFSGMIPEQVVSLSSLTRFLNLSHNVLSGPIPSEVGRLSSIGVLDLSNNELSGDIPQALGECQALEYLFLQGNQLGGRIPQSLNSLKGLQYLDMSQNKLSGPIPEFLATLQYLHYLNLSYNQLDGPVPTRGVFNDTRNFFVTGNRVCGSVSELQLPKCPDTDHSGKGLHRSRTVLIASTTVGSFVALILIICAVVTCARKPVKQLLQSNEASPVPMLMEQHRRLSYGELHRATDGFSAANLIGVGSFGSVYKGILGSEEQEVAIKVLNLVQHGAERSFLAECEALRSARHRNLVKVITACSTVDRNGHDFKALVYEFMPSRDLDKWLHPTIGEDESASRVLTMAERVSIALDVAEALDYLHHHGQAPIVHCDLKPSNVLLDNDMVAHVGDFGLSRFVQGANSSSLQHTSNSAGIRGTIGYIPPEYGMGGEISVEGDVYSYGVLLLEMFTAKRPTDDLFQGGRSIHSYVAAAYPERVMEIVDPALLQAEEREMDEEKMEECIVSVFRVALRCAEESPGARMLTGDVIGELIAVRNVYDQ